MAWEQGTRTWWKRLLQTQAMAELVWGGPLTTTCNHTLWVCTTPGSERSYPHPCQLH